MQNSRAKNRAPTLKWINRRRIIRYILVHGLNSKVLQVEIVIVSNHYIIKIVRVVQHK